MAPAPTTRIRMDQLPLVIGLGGARIARTEWRVENSGLFYPQLFAIRHSPFASLPLLAKQSNRGGYLPATISSTSRSCSLPKNISLPTKNVGEPNAPRSTADWVFSISLVFTSASCERASSLAASRPDEASALAATSGSSIFFGSTHM